MIRGARGRSRALAGVTVLLVGAIVVTTLLMGRPTSRRGAPRIRVDVVVRTHSTSRYGTILVTRGGFTLYTYQLDTRDHSNCVAFCLQMWPALVVTPGEVPVGRGVSGLGTITRSNGEREVTYHGMPLYTYVLDHVPGRTVGEGNGWSVVSVAKTRPTSPDQRGYGESTTPLSPFRS